ncbi:MAG: hypothetical protein ACI9BW_001327 [Gammaproteobacteria bacterium]
MFKKATDGGRIHAIGFSALDAGGRKNLLAFEFTTTPSMLDALSCAKVKGIE